MPSDRLIVVLDSGCLNNRSNAIDGLGSSCFESRSKTDTSKEEPKLTELFDLNVLTASLYATVLEDTIKELQILENSNSSLKIIKSSYDMGLLLANKYKVAQPQFSDELQNIDHGKLWKEEYKLNKLAVDRKVFYDTILGTYLDLSLNRSFQSLAKQIAQYVSRANKYSALVAEDNKYRNTRRELSKQLRSQRIQMTSANYDMDAIIDKLKSEVEDAALKSATRTRYITEWQTARTEQHLQTIKDTEDPPLSNITVHKQKLEDENRVHSEVMLLINLAINETMEKVENIMVKYDKDMEEIDLKIQIKRTDHQTELENRMGLEKLYQQHEKLCKDWMQFKDEREKARQYAIKMTNAAVAVQAWWRGLLVRMQLGPFKPTKRNVPLPKDKKKKQPR